MKQHPEPLTKKEMISRHTTKGGFDRIDQRLLQKVWEHDIDVAWASGNKERIKSIAFGIHYSAYRLGVVLNEVEGDVLEIGCSSGVFSCYFAKFGHRAIGIDFVREQVRKARKLAEEMNVDAKFSQGDAHELVGFSDEIFHTVFLGEILEHVLDPKKVLDEAYRVLKKGGKLIVTIPAQFGEYDFKTVHINQPTAEDIQKISEIHLEELNSLHRLILVGRK